jgi:RHS repeat-associated protein
MEYDYTGTRIKKDAPGSTTLYPFKGYQIDPNGVITKFIRSGNETLASRKRQPNGSTAQYFYHNDHLGGVNVITDSAGARCQLNEYDPWGGVSRSEGPTPGSQPTCDPTHRFTGQELDPETGLYYYGGRYYDQEISRFVSPDPYVQEPDEPQNLNRYTYVLNNPQAYVDPNGHFWWIITAVVSVIAVAAETIWPGLLIALEGGGLTTLGSLVATTIISSAQMGMLSSELQNQAELRPIASKQQSNIQQALRTNESQPGTDSPGSERPADKDSWLQRLADRIGGCRPGG